MVKKLMKLAVLWVLALITVFVPVSADDMRMMISDLETLDKNTAGVATEYGRAFTDAEFMDAEKSWDFDLTVIDSVYDSGFAAKFQMDFRSNCDIPANGAEIRIPLPLLTYDDGSLFYPSDIGVPIAVENAFTEDSNTPFNARIEDTEDGLYLVFFNYVDIAPGTEAVWQTVYGGLDTSLISNGTAWALKADVSVTCPSKDSETGYITEETFTDAVSGVIVIPPDAGGDEDVMISEQENAEDGLLPDDGEGSAVPEVPADNTAEEMPDTEEIQPEDEPDISISGQEFPADSETEESDAVPNSEPSVIPVDPPAEEVPDISISDEDLNEYPEYSEETNDAAEEPGDETLTENLPVQEPLPLIPDAGPSENSDVSVSVPEISDLGSAEENLQNQSNAEIENVSPDVRPWTFDIFYTESGSGSRDFYAEDDFSLEYQMQFDTVCDIPAGGAEIRIPQALLIYRNGSPAVPSNISVPSAESGGQTAADNAFFNWRTENIDGLDYLVFYNCLGIAGGTHCEWTVSYGDLKAAEIPDETEWSLTADITVEHINRTGEGTEISEFDSDRTDPLEGRANTYAELDSLAEEAENTDINSEDQVKAYVSLPENYNFASQRFAVMELTAEGRASQPFDLQIQNLPSDNNIKVLGIVDAETGEAYDLDVCHVFPETAQWRKTFHIILAVPADTDNDVQHCNTAIVTLVPSDQKDNPVSLTALNEIICGTEISLSPEDKNQEEELPDTSNSPQILEIISECLTEVPEYMLNQNLEYRIVSSDTNAPLADIPYRTYAEAVGLTEYAETSFTDESGSFYMRAGQQAVFENITEPVRIEVLENPYWSSSIKYETPETIKIQNTPRPVLCVRNKAEGKDQKKSFSFTLQINNLPASGIRYWLTDAVNEDGSIPVRNGEGITDAEGRFELHDGETAVFIGAGNVGDAYAVTGTGSEKNLETENDAYSGELSLERTEVIITSVYKWADLNITRTVSRQDPEDVGETAFRITEIEGEEIYPAAGNEWELISKEGEILDSGILDENGEFSCDAVKGKITVHKLESGKKYRVEEIIPDGYRTDGPKEIVMPVLSESKEIEFNDEWQKRPLRIKNDLIIDYEDNKELKLSDNAVFELTVSADEPLSNRTFTLTENGKKIKPGSKKDPYGKDNTEFKTDDKGRLKIRGGQTAVFEDAGTVGTKFTVIETPNEIFEQVSPENLSPAKEVMNDEGCDITIVNGTAEFFTISQDWNGLDKTGKEYIKSADLSELSSEIVMTVDNGESWPAEDTEILVIDEKGKIKHDIWKKESSYTITPGTTLAVSRSALNGAESYEIKENDDTDAKTILQNWTDEEGEKHIVQISTESTGSDGAVTGSPDNEPAASIVKTAAAFTEKSRIGIRYTDPDVRAPAGAAQTYKLMVFNAGQWRVVTDDADQVTYYSGCGNEVLIGPTKSSGGDIIMTAGTEGLPWVSFPDDIIYARYIHGPMEGDLILGYDNDSTPDLGYPVGVGTAANNGSYTMSYIDVLRNKSQVEEYMVNTFETIPVKIGKEVDIEHGNTFTFDMFYIVDIHSDIFNEDSGFTEENYERMATHDGIVQPIIMMEKYKSADNSLVEAKRYKNANFTLNAGEYAIVYFPANTFWLVEEPHTVFRYTLDSLEEYSTQTDRSKGSDYLKKLDENVMLVGDGLMYGDAGIIQESVAILFEDGTMIFFEEDPMIYDSLTAQHGNVVGSWTGWDKDVYADGDQVPWHAEAANIQNVELDGNIAPRSTAYWFYGCTEMRHADLTNLNTDNVIDMASMFEGCQMLEELDLSTWHTSHVESFEKMFYYCTNLTSVGDISNWNTSRVNNMYGMFADCILITTFGNLGKWTVYNVENMQGMFLCCNHLKSPGDLSTWETENVTTMHEMFRECVEMTNLGNISNWNTSALLDTSGMFCACRRLSSLDLSNWDTSNVNNMENMFMRCERLISPGDLSSWNTGQVTSMKEMFEDCPKMTDMGDISNWNTSKVTRMDAMFSSCESITSLDVSKWDTGKVGNMAAMFARCKSLTELDLSEWDVRSCVWMDNMFMNCSKLITTGDLDNWNVRKVKEMSYMFSDCAQLTSVGDLSSWDVSNVTEMRYMFYRCQSLQTVGDLQGWSVGQVTDHTGMYTDSYPGLENEGPIFS